MPSLTRFGLLSSTSIRIVVAHADRLAFLAADHEHCASSRRGHVEYGELHWTDWTPTAAGGVQNERSEQVGRRRTAFAEGEDGEYQQAGNVSGMAEQFHFSLLSSS